MTIPGLRRHFARLVPTAALALSAAFCTHPSLAPAPRACPQEAECFPVYYTHANAAPKETRALLDASTLRLVDPATGDTVAIFDVIPQDLPDDIVFILPPATYPGYPVSRLESPDSSVAILSLAGVLLQTPAQSPLVHRLTSDPGLHLPLYPRQETLAQTPEDAMRLVTALSTSPYAESLYTITGRPKGFGLTDQYVGFYDRNTDSVLLNPMVMHDQLELEETLAHELLHRLEHQHPEVVHGIIASAPLVRFSVLYGYGPDSASHLEAHAQAFAYATSLVRRHASEALWHAAERQIPGTIKMAQYLASRSYPTPAQQLAPQSRIAHVDYPSRPR